MIDRVGKYLGNYLLVHLLGRGSFADVYLGKHIHLDTQAAIKVLHGQLAGQDVKDFLTEGRTIARLRHPHIVQVLDFGVEGMIPFLVMDYAPGGNLRQRHPTGVQIPLNTVVSYVKQVAEALEYAHQEKVIHRDIKPENMLLGRQDEVLLSDFGIAILSQSTRSQQAQDNAGTIAYMAPEQIQAHPNFSSDQYALGVVVYEWLSGERPFQGASVEIAIKHALVPPPSLYERVPTLPLEVEQVVLRALAKNSEQRFVSVQAFVEALEVASKSGAAGRIYRGFSVGEPAKDKRVSGQLKSHLHNLPTQVTPLIGREQEIAAAVDLLRRPEVRELTLTGTGGIGKTRLGLQVASELLDTFVDGVYFVPLAPISDPVLVVFTIAQTLGIKEAGERSLLDLLKHFLQDKRVLLLLDNFEQVTAAATVLADLLAACPYLKLLVTSRAMLHVRGEHEFPVPPLALPDLAQLPGSEALVQYPAIVLFLDRALAIKPDFGVTETNARVIAEICARLDGLPLAIELAAVRIKLLPPKSLLQRLEHRLQVLTGGAQDLPARQQTLRNTIAWSYHLLDDRERRLFRRLSVFVGGFTLEAIESICGEPGNEALPMLDEVASLMDKSLLQQSERERVGEGGEEGGEEEAEELRFVMLETIREYGLEALSESNEVERMRLAHAAYYLAFAERAEPELGGPRQALWLGRLERDHDNLRAAMRWSQDGQRGGNDVGMALRMGGALRRFWIVHSHISEGRTFLDYALAASEGVKELEAAVRAKALITAANLAVIQSDYQRAEVLATEGLELDRELGDQAGVALSLYLWGSSAWTQGNSAATRSLTEEALAISRALGDNDRVAWSLFTLGKWHSSRGEYARARDLFEESLVMHRELGSKRGMASSLTELAQLLFVSRGDAETIHTLLGEGHTLFRELGYKEGIADALELAGKIALNEGEVDMAQQLAEESMRLYKEVGFRWGMVSSLCLLAKVAARQGDRALARELYEESLALASEVGRKELVASSLEGLAGIIADQGEAAWAVQLWGAAESLRIAMGIAIAPVELADYERAMAAAREKLGKKTFEARWAEGREMTAEQALAARGVGSVSSKVSKAASKPVYAAGLTAREVEVLRLVVRGMTNMQIAQELVLSEKTVATHLSHIFNKTNSDNRAGAVAFAIRHGLA